MPNIRLTLPKARGLVESGFMPNAVQPEGLNLDRAIEQLVTVLLWLDEHNHWEAAIDVNQALEKLYSKRDRPDPKSVI